MTLPIRRVRRASPYRNTSKPLSVVDLARTKDEIRHSLNEIEKHEGDIRYRQGLISRQKHVIRRQQYVIWRHEQDIDDQVTDREIEDDDLFHIRFPNHEAI